MPHTDIKVGHTVHAHGRMHARSHQVVDVDVLLQTQEVVSDALGLLHGKMRIKGEEEERRRRGGRVKWGGVGAA